MGEPQRRRLTPDARRALLLDAALDTFVTQGYAPSGLAEIADAAGVSKTLLYHYFPDGRPELYREVVTRLTHPALDEVRGAARAPISADRRLTLVIDVVLSLFETHPAAYRLAVLEPNGSGDAGIAGQAMALRASLVSALAAVLASTNHPPEEIAAGASVVLGALFAVCELRITGALDAEQARRVAGEFVRGGLTGLGLLG